MKNEKSVVIWNLISHFSLLTSHQEGLRNVDRI